jgi:tRNA nucleotidyltransferase (CCA-adding enzyme)
VVDIVALHDYPIVPNGWQGEAKYVMRALSKLGEALLRDLIEMKRADNSSKQPHVKDRLVLLDRVTEALDGLLSQNPCFTLKSLCIDGSRLIELGLSGKQIGDALNGALNAVIEGTVQNEGQALEQFIISNYVDKANKAEQ